MTINSKRKEENKNYKPKRILFISHSASVDGAEQCLLDLLGGLGKDNFEPIVLLPEDGPLCDLIRALKIETIIFKIPLWIARHRRTKGHFKSAFLMMPKRIKCIRKLIKEKKIDLVYTNTITIIDGAIAAKLERIPHVWHIHEILSRTKNLKPYLPLKIIKYLVFSLSDKIITPASIAKEDIRCCNDNKIEIVHNGIDLERFGLRKTNGDFRKEMGVTPGEKIITLIGNLREDKGHTDFIEAASLVCERVDECIFVIVGDGPPSYTQILQNRIRKLGLSERVKLIGYRYDVAGILESVYLLVSASWAESFSLVVCEAMAAGKPVVATRCGGPEELVIHGETGLLVPVRSPREMANAITEILLDESMASEMGKNGKERLMDEFSHDKFVRNIENIINATFSSPSA